MYCYFLSPKPKSLILQIPYIQKYLDLFDTVLGVSEIRIRSVFLKQKNWFPSGLKIMKNTITTDTTIY